MGLEDSGFRISQHNFDLTEWQHCPSSFYFFHSILLVAGSPHTSVLKTRPLTQKLSRRITSMITSPIQW